MIEQIFALAFLYILGGIFTLKYWIMLDFDYFAKWKLHGPSTDIDNDWWFPLLICGLVWPITLILLVIIRFLSGHKLDPWDKDE